MQIQMQSRCRMQNADAECIADANCIAELQIRKHSVDISNGLRARGAGPDLIASRIPPGLVGSRAPGEEAFSEEQ